MANFNRIRTGSAAVVPTPLRRRERWWDGTRARPAGYREKLAMATFHVPHRPGCFALAPITASERGALGISCVDQLMTTTDSLGPGDIELSVRGKGGGLSAMTRVMPGYDADGWELLKSWPWPTSMRSRARTGSADGAPTLLRWRERWRDGVCRRDRRVPREVGHGQL